MLDANATDLPRAPIRSVDDKYIFPMAKQDFPALLIPGMHTLTVDELHNLAVLPFDADAQRQDLHQKLSLWMRGLQGAGVGGTLWIDGSFLTEKPGPADIDCVLWHPRWKNGMSGTPDVVKQVERLLDHASAMTFFGLDLYVEPLLPPEDTFHREAYWRGVLGFEIGRAHV